MFDDKPPHIHPEAVPNGRQALAGVSPRARNYVQLAQDAFRMSTTYMDSNYRQVWENSIRAFNNQHPNDSKYTSPSYSKRSTVFRPKTRSIIRKNEAAAAAAFFSNSDVVSVEPVDAANPKEVASAEIMKQLLQYRLKKSVPWFKIVQGAIQEAQVTAACARVEWLFEKKDGKVVKDRPDLELIPIENLRFDAGASWLDPVNTSPYFIHLMPMYAGDVRERMGKLDEKTGKPKWKKLDESFIRSATMSNSDSTRLTRNVGREDPQANDEKLVSDYEIVWVQRHIHRVDGEDVEWYMLGTEAMLTEPRPLSQSVLHGARPYVIGVAILEAHKTLPVTVPQLLDGLQRETNEIANQRLDNVKFVLNKRWFVQRGKNADLASMIRNVPGGVTLVDGNPSESIKEVNWPDVTGSSYQEQDRLNADIDELGGNFSAASVSTNGQTYATTGKMELLQTPASMITEYLLRTFTETFVEPVLRMLIKLEQYYETDRVILGIAAKQAQLFQRFGMDEVTDEMMSLDLTLNVNVGMGATNPQQKLAKFNGAVSIIAGAAKVNKENGILFNLKEVAKEAWAHSGYQGGERFMAGEDPALQQAQQQLQQAQQMIGQLQMKLKEKETGHIVKAQTNTENNQTKVLIETIRQTNENKRAQEAEIHENRRSLMAHVAQAHHNQYTKSGVNDVAR